MRQVTLNARDIWMVRRIRCLGDFQCTEKHWLGLGVLMLVAIKDAKAFNSHFHRNIVWAGGLFQNIEGTFVVFLSSSVITGLLGEDTQVSEDECCRGTLLAIDFFINR